MSKWEKAVISSLCQINIGRTPARDNPSFWKDGTHDWMTISDLSDKYIFRTKEKITDMAVSECRMQAIPADTVVMSFKLSLGKVGITCKSMFSNEAIASFSIKDRKKLDENYLYYALKSMRFNNADRAAKGMTLNKSKLNQLIIPIPPLEVQKDIAKKLDSVAELLSLLHQQSTELDQLIKSVFYKMFGDPAVNEKGWEKGAIGDLAKNINYGTSQKASTEPEGIPILRMNNITYEGTMDYTDLKYIVLSEKDKKKYLVHKGELLFNRTNSKELVGKTAVYKRDEPMAFAGYLIRLVPNERANSEYISGYLNSKHGKRILYGMAKNIIGMANINAKEFASIPIPIPPISLQNKYADIVSEIEEQKSLVKQAIDETQHLFDSLMSKYFDD